jgi:hypothetical protein
MSCSVGQFGEWFAVVNGKVPVNTPGGTPLISHHRALAEQMARDITATGLDPTAQTNMYALQAGYLDFGLKMPREELEIPVLDIWASDIFVNRPASPELMMPLLALWGPQSFGRKEFVDKVHAVPLRQLMVLVQCGAQYQSAVLGLYLLSTERDPAGFALGACARYWAHLNRELTLEKGYLSFGGDGGRCDPANADDEYCEEMCCEEDGPNEDFPRRCPVHGVFSTMRAWAAFPEERQ